MHLRIDGQLDAQLRQQAAAEHIPMSALVRRLLRQAAHEYRTESASKAEVEEIDRRIPREEIHRT
ncbi:ribbon-helix-helix protein, CopG family [Halosaccharopolyspora lacisalsi]